MRKLILLLALLLSFNVLAVQVFSPSKDENHFNYSGTIAATSSVTIKIPKEDGYSLQLKLTDASPAVITILSTSGYISAETDSVYKASHGLATGMPLTLTTSSATPAGLVPAVYVYKINDDFFQLMDTKDKAVAGTPALDITDAGTGLQTFTPGNFTGSIYVKYSVNNTDFNTIQTYTAANIGTTLLEDDNFNADWLQLLVIPTAGQAGIIWDVNAK